MAADSKHAEALARIEHKLDVALAMIMFLVTQPQGGYAVLSALKEKIQVGNSRHVCPICAQVVEYSVDPVDSVVVRKCNCKTGKIAIDMKAFASPALPVIKETDSGEQEDRNDATSRSRPPGR